MLATASSARSAPSLRETCAADTSSRPHGEVERLGGWRGRSRRSRTAGEIHVLLHTPALHLYGRRARARGDVLHAVLAPWAPHWQ